MEIYAQPAHIFGLFAQLYANNVIHKSQVRITLSLDEDRDTFTGNMRRRFFNEICTY